MSWLKVVRRISFAPLALVLLVPACSGADESSDPDPMTSDTCDVRTDLTQGSIDGPACDMGYEALGKNDQSASFNMCTEYLYETTLANEEGQCDQANLLGRCITVDNRDPSLVSIVYMYDDQDSTLGQCDKLKLKSYQCLNRAANTWCGVS